MWWRTPVSLRPSNDLAIAPVEFPEQAEDAPVRATGVWELTGTGAGFGGFSALLLRGNRIAAFSDRGWRLSFSLPDRDPDFETAQVLPERRWRQVLFDIEGATLAADGRTYWVSYEGRPTIQRFDSRHAADGARRLKGMHWAANGGLEAMTRLSDGAFLILTESAREAYLFAGDPVEGARLTAVPVRWPVAEFVPTDAAQLPDGRVLVLMRRFTMGLPNEWRSLLAVADAPQAGEPWEPQVLADLEGILPPENYEGLAVRSTAGGSTEIWLISDNNFSAFQRALLARLVLGD